VIATPELLYSAQLIYAENYKTIPLLLVASIWYLIVTTVLTIGQFFLERRYGRGTRRNQAPTWWGRLFRSMRPFRHEGAEELQRPHG
jgi:polar amino acid transport system permease protein